MEDSKKNVPLLEMLNEPQEIADTMLWLGSEDASFVNGECMEIDGGQSLTDDTYFDFFDYL